MCQILLCFVFRSIVIKSIQEQLSGTNWFNTHPTLPFLSMFRKITNSKMLIDRDKTGLVFMIKPLGTSQTLIAGVWRRISLRVLLTHNIERHFLIARECFFFRERF
jgi:hypothetical protein